MQRGKFNNQQDNANKVGADEMLTMIQHGAQEIILTCDDDDVDMKKNLDQIIDKSLKKTEELEKQLKSIEDKFNLNQVSLTGDDEGHKTSIYQLDGEVINRKQLAEGQTKIGTFIDIGARKKQLKNYNVNENFRAALGQNPAIASGS